MRLVFFLTTTLSYAMLYLQNLKHKGVEMKKKGLLIAIEGLDGSGKTTQADLLKDWLEKQGYRVMKSEWYRTKTIYDLNMRLNLLGQMTDQTAFTLVAAEFAARWEYIIRPALEQGTIVVAEKYIYTPLAKDVARGAELEFVKALYQFAPLPDLVFYLKVTVETALQRIIQTRPLHFWESGLDLSLNESLQDSLRLYYQGKISQQTMAEGFKSFQSLVSQEYEGMIQTEGMIVIDETKDIKQQHESIKEWVEKALKKRSRLC